MKTPFDLKKEITAIAIVLSSIAYGQVGINNTDPKATLDVTAKTTDGSKAEGIIAPRLTGDEIKAGDTKYNAAQTGTIIYATAAVTGTPAGKTINITDAGYYYFDGNVWQKMSGSGSADINIYKDNGTLTSNRTVTMSDKTLSFNSTATAGTSHFNIDGNTFNVDALNNRVGIGTATPQQQLHATAGIRAGSSGNGFAELIGGDANSGYVGFNKADGTKLGYIGYSSTDMKYFAEGGSNHIFIGSTTSNGKVGVGNTTPNAKLDIRTNTASTTDPGAGMFGIGTTTALAPAAGAGAVRYSTNSGGVLQYSNGVTWNTLTSTVQKSIVTGYFTNGVTYSLGVVNLNTTESNDVNNDYNPAVSTFTAPRTGLYLINANLLTTFSKIWTLNEELSLFLSVTGAGDSVSSGYFADVARTGFGGPNIGAVIKLDAGSQIQFKAFTTNGFSVHTANFNRFSIVEL